MKVLHIDSSILGDASVSRQLSQAIVAQLKSKHSDAQVDYVDLAITPVAHLDAEIMMGKNPEQAAISESLLQQYETADVVVIGAGMYNFGISSTLKAWLDRLCVAGRTFKYTENGAVGLVANKKTYIASSRGGVYGDNSPADFQEDQLKAVLNFTGISDIEVIRAEGVNMGAEMKAQAITAAMSRIQSI